MGMTLRTAWIAGAFLVLALFTSLLLAVVMPLGQVADEGAHAARVEALSDGHAIGLRQGTMGGFRIHPTFWDVARMTPKREVQTRQQRDAAENLPWADNLWFLDIGTIATYFPAVYAPAALTVAVARELNATPAQAYRAGRRINAVLYAALGASALLIARRGRALIATALLLPMSLSLAASLSADGPLIALAALAAACLARGRDGAAPRLWWVAAGCLLVIGLTKLPYAALLLPLALAPGPRPATRVRVAVALAVVMVGWTAWNQQYVMGFTGRAPYEAGPLWPGPSRVFDRVDTPAQLQVLAADPALAVTLVARRLREDMWLRREMIGVLGWLHIELPEWVYALWTGVLVLVVPALALERGPGARVNAGAGLALLAAAWGIMMVQYLGWTNVGAETIDGVQGRYFIPLLPFLAVAIPGFALRRAPWIAGGVAALPMLAGAACAVTVPLVVALASYLR